jgi:hypothetical protein
MGLLTHSRSLSIAAVQLLLLTEGEAEPRRKGADHEKRKYSKLIQYIQIAAHNCSKFEVFRF